VEAVEAGVVAEEAAVVLIHIVEAEIALELTGHQSHQTLTRRRNDSARSLMTVIHTDYLPRM
jgi:hypothetical protein